MGPSGPPTSRVDPEATPESKRASSTRLVDHHKSFLAGFVSCESRDCGSSRRRGSLHSQTLDLQDLAYTTLFFPLHVRPKVGTLDFLPLEPDERFFESCSGSKGKNSR